MTDTRVHFSDDNMGPLCPHLYLQVKRKSLIPEWGVKKVRKFALENDQILLSYNVGVFIARISSKFSS